MAYTGAPLSLSGPIAPGARRESTNASTTGSRKNSDDDGTPCLCTTGEGHSCCPACCRDSSASIRDLVAQTLVHFKSLRSQMDLIASQGPIITEAWTLFDMAREKYSFTAHRVCGYVEEREQSFQQLRHAAAQEGATPEASCAAKFCKSVALTVNLRIRGFFLHRFQTDALVKLRDGLDNVAKHFLLLKLMQNEGFAK
jgi:hypothetical protein